MQNQDVLSFLNSAQQQKDSSDLDFWLSVDLKETPPVLAPTSSVDTMDKKKKNTLASARFRAKKKQKEQEMLLENQNLQREKSILEAKVKEQELEIKWLRDMVMEKNKNSSNVDIQQLLSLVARTQN